LGKALRSFSQNKEQELPAPIEALKVDEWDRQLDVNIDVDDVTALLLLHVRQGGGNPHIEALCGHPPNRAGFLTRG
jgi:hypothetical protein